MSENYSNEMFNINERVKLMLKVRKEKGVFTPEELDVLDLRSHNNVFSNLNNISDDMDIAMLVTNGGLAYSSDGRMHNVGITHALLANMINVAYLKNNGSYQSWFTERDSNKATTTYEMFVNQYFYKMFGDEGFRKLLSGDGVGFMKDLENYGATNEEITKFEDAIDNSVFTGEYSMEDEMFMAKFSDNIAKGRFLYESSMVDEVIETKKRTL